MTAGFSLHARKKPAVIDRRYSGRRAKRKTWREKVG
jgi:hypothetical protein